MRRLILIIVILSILFSCKKTNIPSQQNNNTDTTHHDSTITHDTIALSKWYLNDTLYSEDTAHLTSYLTTWDSISNSLTCEGDTSNSLNEVARINLYFKNKPTTSKNYTAYPHYGYTINDTTCSVVLTMINPSQGINYWQPDDSTQYIHVVVANGKIRAWFSNLNIINTGIFTATGNGASYFGTMSGSINEK